MACNMLDKELTEDERKEVLRMSNDSLIVVFDSLMAINVDLPPLIDSTIVSPETVEGFNELARATNGQIKVLLNSNLVTETMIEIVERYAVDNTDIMFVIDNTASMHDDLDDIKKGLAQIITTLEKYDNIRLSIATYGDKNIDGDKWYRFKNFEGDFFATRSFIEKIKISGGGDYPESVYDGIHRAFQEGFWQSGNKRMVLLLGDAPSLGPELSDHNVNDIIALATNERINMNFYPIVLSPFEAEVLEKSEPRMTKKSFISTIYPNPSSGLIQLILQFRIY